MRRGIPILDFKPSGLPSPENIPNDTVLKNINCYEYLGYIAANITDELVELSPHFAELHKAYRWNPKYDSQRNYGDFYTEFLHSFQKDIDKILIKKDDYIANIQILQHELNKLNPTSKDTSIKSKIISIEGEIKDAQKQYHALNSIILLLYQNPNHALERSYQMVKSELTTVSHTSHAIESVVTERLKKEKSELKTQFRPVTAGSNYGRLRASVGDYNPMIETNLPSTRTYQYQEQEGPTELRFGTQAIILGDAKVNPLFSAFVSTLEEVYENEHNEQKIFQLEIKEEDWFSLAEDKEQKQEDTTTDLFKHHIVHLYINNLTLEDSSYEKNRERSLSLQLHNLMDNFLHLVVITLPAQMSLLQPKKVSKHGNIYDASEIKAKMLEITLGKDDKPLEDFFINDYTKRLLYGESTDGPYNKTKEKEIMSQLLEKSFDTMGIDSSKEMTEQQVQAVFFHLIKYEVSHFIIKTLNPDSFNMSCKDAIDRGGVSSAYYNLLNSIKSGSPLSEDEFYCALFGAPTVVKGRGMNEHILLIWNAVDSLIKGHDKVTSESGLLPEFAIPSWLRTWRDDNALLLSRTDFILQLQQLIRHEMTTEPTLLFYNSENIQVAKKLIAMLENNNVSFTPEEKLILSTGDLGKICQEIIKCQLLPFEKIFGDDKQADKHYGL